jgi:hypothetical protein
MTQAIDDEPLLSSAYGLLAALGSQLSQHGQASGIAAQDLGLCQRALSEAVLSIASEAAPGESLPMDFHGDLASAIDTLATHSPQSSTLIEHFLALLPALRWRSRQAQRDQDNHFVSRHRNSWLVGPGAPIDCTTMALGLSLLQPHVAYPFHQHPPTEFYLVLSPGEWFREGAGWWTPGINGVVFNPANCRHAMKSLDRPLWALWGLIG